MGRQLTHSYLTRVLNYDPDTGSFSWRIDIPKKIKAGMPAGSVNRNKRSIGLNGESHFCHRLAWFYVHGAWPDGYIVPINGDFLDCRIANLKCEARAETVARSAARVTSTSGVKGVSWDTKRRKWIASVRINYRQFNLGGFNTIEEAAAACEAAKANAPVADQATLQEKREELALVARQRRAYKRAIDNAGNCAWPSFESFVADVGVPPRDGSILVPLDASCPVGPGNYTWAKPARYNKKTAEGRLSATREWRTHNYERYRAHGLRKSFGLEIHEYQEMHDRQNGLCACCGQPERGLRGGFPIKLAVDHNHTTGEIRALLCGDCNKGIGYFREDADRLRKAAAYLEHHAEKSKSKAAA